MTFVHSIVCIIIATIILFGVCTFLYERFKKKWKLNLATVVSTFWGLAIAVLLLDTIFYEPDHQVQIQAILAGLGGASLGWLVGMWISPMGKSESAKFGRYWTAIGVGSGFSAKWAMDAAIRHKTVFSDHWFVAATFAIAFLVAAATVYNSRAYDSSLDIYVRTDPGSTQAISTDPVTIGVGKSLSFYADVCGASDSLSRWAVFPDGFGTFDQSSGLFKAGPTKMTGKITAQNIEDPTLSNYVLVEVVEPIAAQAEKEKAKEAPVAST